MTLGKQVLHNTLTLKCVVNCSAAIRLDWSTVLQIWLIGMEECVVQL